MGGAGTFTGTGNVSREGWRAEDKEPSSQGESQGKGLPWAQMAGPRRDGKATGGTAGEGAW